MPSTRPILISGIITAQFRPEKMQEVPISMTVVSGDALDEMTNLADVAAQAPNVILRDGGGGFGKVMQSYIRYVGQSDYSFTEEPGVGVYVDDEYLATLDVPLIASTLFLRFAALSNQRNGYVEQLDYGCVNPDLGGIVDLDAPLLPLLTAPHRTTGHCQVGDLGGENVQAARLSLRWLISERLEANFANPSNPLGGFNANVAVPLYGIPYDARFIAPGFYQSYLSFGPLPHIGPSDTGPAAVTGFSTIPDESGVKAYGATATLDWNVFDSLQLKSVSAAPWGQVLGEPGPPREWSATVRYAPKL